MLLADVFDRNSEDEREKQGGDEKDLVAGEFHETRGALT